MNESSAPGAPRFAIGHVPIDGVSRSEALDRIAALVERRQGGAVFTPNVDHVVLAHEDPAFREAYGSVDLSVVDGMPVLWACRALGLPVREKISGSDIVSPLASLAAHRGWRVFLLGGRTGAAERAAARLVENAPGLLIVGMSGAHVDMSRPMTEREALIDEIRRASPDVVLVALGSPKGELIAHEFRATLKPAVFVCVGAALDFLAGLVPRAPGWVSSAGLEWLYRLAREPRRLWARYLLRGPRFLPIVAKALLVRAGAHLMGPRGPSDPPR